MQRLFVIGPDNGTLDDYAFRLIPYIKSLCATDGISRTVYFGENGAPATCVRYMPDGSVVDGVCEHPLDGGVDLVVTCFSEFRSLFFGAGGVHGLPASVDTGIDDPLAPERRDLFYFDDAHSYQPDEFTSFLRLVEFLFAEDLDVVIGTTSWNPTIQAQLAFLEVLSLPEANNDPHCTIEYCGNTQGGWEDIRVIDVVRVADRPVFVAENDEGIPALQAIIRKHLGVEPAVYTSSLPASERLKIYEGLKASERSSDGYILIADAAAFETADLSSDVVVTGLCPPEGLVRRAGRCNRHGCFAKARLIVVDSGWPDVVRTMPVDLRSEYNATLTGLTAPSPFSLAEWQRFVA
jgi:CRISPR-associated endonuclease/helicase Cas3